MNRKQWVIFAVCMCALFPALAVALPNAAQHPWIMVVPACVFVVLMGSTVGWMAVRGVLNALTRRRGVPMLGRVVHARSVGYINHVPTWEVEAALPNGHTAAMLISRYAPFSPGEPLQLLVDPKHPTRAVRLPAPNYDF